MLQEFPWENLQKQKYFFVFLVAVVTSVEKYHCKCTLGYQVVFLFNLKTQELNK